MRNDEKTRQCVMLAKVKFKETWRKFREVSYDDVVRYLYSPTDPSSLGVVRFLFGLLMLVDLPEERGGSDIDIRWGNPSDCHFPLFPILKNPGFPCMCMLYCMMWLGACGIMLGYKFRWSVLLFGVPYWYILLLDKSYWNNHSYLFGLVTILLAGSSANHFLSLDGYLDTSKKNKHVPYWNYFILKYQFFLLYFLAGLKKTDMEWLEGYSMKDIGEHWVFVPFQFILSSDKIEYLIVHWFGFILDLTIGFWMLVEFTRPVAMLFCACFHLMNSRLFSIDDPENSLEVKEISNYITSDNISVYVDVWCSLNKRFQQRMYDPNYDLLRANWSPFESVEWLMPVLMEYSGFRTTMNDISREVYSWSNNSDVLFIADFPGMYLENFINNDLQNVTLTVLEGRVVFEMEDQETLQSIGVTMKKGESVPVEVGIFHKVHTIGESPSCYMYTFIREEVADDEIAQKRYTMYSPFPLVEDIQDRMESFTRMWRHIGSSFLYVLLGRPYQLRSRK